VVNDQIWMRVFTCKERGLGGEVSTMRFRHLDNSCVAWDGMDWGEVMVVVVVVVKVDGCWMERCTHGG
jgi:hypothetical protein